MTREQTPRHTCTRATRILAGTYSLQARRRHAAVTLAWGLSLRRTSATAICNHSYSDWPEPNPFHHACWRTPPALQLDEEKPVGARLGVAQSSLLAASSPASSLPFSRPGETEQEGGDGGSAMSATSFPPGIIMVLSHTLGAAVATYCAYRAVYSLCDRIPRHKSIPVPLPRGLIAVIFVPASLISFRRGDGEEW